VGEEEKLHDLLTFIYLIEVNYQIRELHNFYLNKYSFIFSVKQQPKSGLGESSLLRFLDLSLTHKHTHTHIHTVGLLRTSDQPLAEVATYTTNNKHKR
jgi:hypothetical protein